MRVFIFGDVWEGFFLGSVDDLREASEQEIKDAMKLANRAAVHRMLTGGSPAGI